MDEIYRVVEFLEESNLPISLWSRNSGAFHLEFRDGLEMAIEIPIGRPSSSVPSQAQGGGGGGGGLFWSRVGPIPDADLETTLRTMEDDTFPIDHDGYEKQHHEKNNNKDNDSLMAVQGFIVAQRRNQTFADQQSFDYSILAYLWQRQVYRYRLKQVQDECISREDDGDVMVSL